MYIYPSFSSALSGCRHSAFLTSDSIFFISSWVFQQFSFSQSLSHRVVSQATSGICPRDTSMLKAHHQHPFHKCFPYLRVISHVIHNAIYSQFISSVYIHQFIQLFTFCKKCHFRYLSFSVLPGGLC